MRIDGVAINVSPLINPFRIGQADLLSQLFGKIVVKVLLESLPWPS